MNTNSSVLACILLPFVLLFFQISLVSPQNSTVVQTEPVEYSFDFKMQQL